MQFEGCPQGSIVASIASFYIEFYKVWIRTENLINFIGMEVVKRNEVVYYVLCFLEEENKRKKSFCGNFQELF